MFALPQGSDVDLIGNGEGVIDLNAEVADSAFDFAMAKKELNGPKVCQSFGRSAWLWYF